MHISDGILPVSISIAADAAALTLVYAGGKNLKSDEIPKMGVFTAALFIISLINFPILGTSIHLGLYGFAGILFGMRALPIIFVSLLFQCLLFQHGGLLAIGANTLNMGSGALISALIWQLRRINRDFLSFCCGFLGVLVPVFLLSLFFIMAHYGRGMWALITLYLIPAIIEGGITVFIYRFFVKVKPEYFK